MNADRPVEVTLREAGRYGNRQSLHEFRRRIAHHMGTQNHIRSRIHHQLDERLPRSSGNRLTHRPELRRKNLQIGFLASLLFRQADGRERLKKNTAFGVVSNDQLLADFANNRSARMCPSAMAVGVRLYRSVTSPMA